MLFRNFSYKKLLIALIQRGAIALVALAPAEATKTAPAFAESLEPTVTAVRVDGSLAHTLRALNTNRLQRLHLYRLERKLSAELGGADVDLSPLGTSQAEVAIALEAANEFILSLDSEQLEGAVRSPTLTALLQMLSTANQSAADSETIVLKISLR